MSSRTKKKIAIVRKNLEQIRACYSLIVDQYDDFDMMSFPIPVEIKIDEGALLDLMKHLEGKTND